jgi:hypothetical protein
VNEYRWPNRIAPERSAFRLLNLAAIGKSPFRANVQAAGPLTQQWAAEVVWPIADYEEWPEMLSIIARLRGRVNLLRITDFARRKPLGAAAGISRKYAAPQTGFTDSTLFTDGTGFSDGGSSGVVEVVASAGNNTLIISGLVPNQAISIEHSDLMEINGYLYMSVTRSASDTTGKARVVIEPALRTHVFSGDRVLFVDPTSPFQLAAEEGVESSFIPGGGLGDEPMPHLEPISLKLVEFIP